MPNFNDLILSVTFRLVHQEDFTFKKNNGEIANRLRSKFSGVTPTLSLSGFKGIRIDADGDIVIKTEKGSLYVSSDSVFVVGWLTTPRILSEGQHVEELSRILEFLLEARDPLVPEAYQVRIFFTARFVPKHGLNLLSRCSHGALESILGEKTPSETEIVEFRMSADYERGVFSDSLELDGSTIETQLRYGRVTKAANFDSYRAFLEAADLRALVEDLRPFIEVFLADPSKLLGRVFREAQQAK